jgi:hypothetical protein
MSGRDGSVLLRTVGGATVAFSGGNTQERDRRFLGHDPDAHQCRIAGYG